MRGSVENKLFFKTVCTFVTENKAFSLQFYRFHDKAPNYRETKTNTGG